MSLFLLGALAGLGVAMPLGAIGVLLIREGVVAGFRIAAAGAAAVALVDAAYCVLAVTVGSVAAPWIDALGPAPQAVAGVVLVGLGVSGLVRSGTTARADGTPSDRTPIGAFARFAGLTTINPATLVYFFALTAALSISLRPDGSLALFVVGVGVASALWQLGLAAVGAFLGGRLGPAGHRAVSVAGSLIVVSLGVLSLALAAAGLFVA